MSAFRHELNPPPPPPPPPPLPPQSPSQSPSRPPPPPHLEIAYPSWRGYLSKEVLETSSPDDPVKTRNTHTYYVTLISQLTRLLGFPRATWATAILLCTRFYAAHPVLEHPPFLIAIAALFVAGKVEETYKRLKDVLSLARSLPSLGEDGPEKNLSFEALHQQVLRKERLIFRSIRFDVGFRHPFVFIPKYTLMLHGSKALGEAAWSLSIAMYSTNLPIQYPPHTLAAASILLSTLSHPDLSPPSFTPSGPWAYACLQALPLAFEDYPQGITKAEDILKDWHKAWSNHPAFKDQPKGRPEERIRAEALQDGMTLRYLFKS
ncbi:cyclin-like protein [Piptocephalis cylindrospora]|uniref:Cyclin-like protein n=1 Tax=Piptocephalis cylindrospora TaxID=1907219 RepID=A0A4P9Y0P3_9FUNG|nr:cyclin-like protein [Piptocephalis cylindrospora]|eukprot:RKP12308.1 cyclin-like protein [Piptocephalis cylindrospora]